MVIHRGCNAARRYNLLGRNKSMQVNESRILSTVFRPPFIAHLETFFSTSLPVPRVCVFSRAGSLLQPVGRKEKRKREGKKKEKKRQEEDKAEQKVEFSCVQIESSSLLEFSLESFACSRNLSNGKRGLRGGRGLETREEIDASLIFPSP